MFMNAFTLETGATNATPQEVADKSVEVKQVSAKPPHLDSSTSFRKTTCASVAPSSYSLSCIGDFFTYLGDV